MDNPLKHWNGTEEEFWAAVRNPLASQQPGDEQPSASAILGEVLRLAGERAEQIHRTRQMAAAGYKSPMSLFQIQMGIEQEDHDKRQRRYAERCREEIQESRYLPRRARESG